MKTKFLFVILMLICLSQCFAADKNPGSSIYDSKILIAIITGVVGFITSIITSVRSYRQTKKIEELKTELAIKQESDNNKFKFILSYESEKVNQYLLSLKDFQSTSQKTKDEVRNLLDSYEQTFELERNEKIASLKSKIVDKYAEHSYYFNSADKDKNAHLIKILFVEIFGLLQNKPANFKKLIDNKISEITRKQLLLHEEIEDEVKKKLASL